MKARLIRYYGELRLLCADGTIAVATDSLLRRLFVGHAGAEKLKGKCQLSLKKKKKNCFLSDL